MNASCHRCGRIKWMDYAAEENDDNSAVCVHILCPFCAFEECQSDPDSAKELNNIFHHDYSSSANRAPSEDSATVFESMAKEVQGMRRATKALNELHQRLTEFVLPQLGFFPGSVSAESEKRCAHHMLEKMKTIYENSINPIVKQVIAREIEQIERQILPQLYDSPAIEVTQEIEDAPGLPQEEAIVAFPTNNGLQDPDAVESGAIDQEADHIADLIKYLQRTPSQEEASNLCLQLEQIALTSVGYQSLIAQEGGVSVILSVLNKFNPPVPMGINKSALLKRQSQYKPFDCNGSAQVTASGISALASLAFNQTTTKDEMTEKGCVALTARLMNQFEDSVDVQEAAFALLANLALECSRANAELLSLGVARLVAKAFTSHPDNTYVQDQARTLCFVMVLNEDTKIDLCRNLGLDVLVSVVFNFLDSAREEDDYLRVQCLQALKALSYEMDCYDIIPALDRIVSFVTDMSLIGNDDELFNDRVEILANLSEHSNTVTTKIQKQFVARLAENICSMSWDSEEFVTSRCKAMSFLCGCSERHTEIFVNAGCLRTVASAMRERRPMAFNWCLMVLSHLARHNFIDSLEVSKGGIKAIFDVMAHCNLEGKASGILALAGIVSKNPPDEYLCLDANQVEMVISVLEYSHIEEERRAAIIILSNSSFPWRSETMKERVTAAVFQSSNFTGSKESIGELRLLGDVLLHQTCLTEVAAEVLSKILNMMMESSNDIGLHRGGLASIAAILEEDSVLLTRTRFEEMKKALVPTVVHAMKAYKTDNALQSSSAQILQLLSSRSNHPRFLSRYVQEVSSAVRKGDPTIGGRCLESIMLASTNREALSKALSTTQDTLSDSSYRRAAMNLIKRMSNKPKGVKILVSEGIVSALLCQLEAEGHASTIRTWYLVIFQNLLASTFAPRVSQQIVDGNGIYIILRTLKDHWERPGLMAFVEVLAKVVMKCPDSIPSLQTSEALKIIEHASQQTGSSLFQTLSPDEDDDYFWDPVNN